MMTTDEIIDKDEVLKMARQADSGFEGGEDADGTMGDSIVGIEAVIRFGKLVAEAAASKEREACAKVCEDISPKTEPVEYGDIRWGWKYKCPYAAAIRARGKPTSRGEA